MNPKKPFHFFLKRQLNILLSAKSTPFQKKLPKHILTLKFQQEATLPSNPPFKCKTKLLQNLKLIKSSQNIDLQELTSLVDLTPFELKKIAKILTPCRNFKLPSASFSFSTSLLKQCKNLTSFASFFEEITSYGLIPFLRAFARKKKLKQVAFVFKENHIYVPFSCYPSNLQKISIHSRAKTSPLFPSMDTREYKLAFSHLKNLQHLDLGIALHPAAISRLLLTIINPKGLQSLGLCLANVFHGAPSGTKNLAKTLQKFQNLKNLKLHIKISAIIFKIVETLENWALESFELDVPLLNEAELSFLGCSLGTLKSLKKLVVRLQSSAQVDIPEAFTSFFSQISTLAQLQILEFHFECPVEDLPKCSGSKIISALSDCISKLPHLKELNFYYKKKDLSSGLGSLSKALEKIGQNLTRLELEVRAKDIESHDFTDFIQTLNSMKKLEVRKLTGFQVKK